MLADKVVGGMVCSSEIIDGCPRLSEMDGVLKAEWNKLFKENQGLENQCIPEIEVNNEWTAITR